MMAHHQSGMEEIGKTLVRATTVMTKDTLPGIVLTIWRHEVVDPTFSLEGLDHGNRLNRTISVVATMPTYQ